MKNIIECIPLEFACFYYTEIQEPISLYVPSPSGDIAYSEFEQFLTANGSVIAFRKFSHFATDYAYRAVFSSGEFLIQYQTYEGMKDVIDGIDQHDNGYYIIFNSKPFSTNPNLIVNTEERCDTEIYASVVFSELSDGTDSPLTDPNAVTRSNLDRIVPVISVPGAASIMRADFKELHLTYFNYKIVTTVARTFLGALRLACEWKATTLEPFNSQEIPAQKIAQLVDGLNIDDRLFSAIINAQKPMPVSLFLSHSDNARVAVDENNELTEDIRSWIKGLVRYRTLSSLSRNLDIAAEFPENMLTSETNDINSVLHQYCLANSIDISTITTVQDLVLSVGRQVIEPYGIRIDAFADKWSGL